MTSASPPAATVAVSDDVISERHLRKRLAARVRQQRCRARKREAKLAKAQRNVKAPRPTVQQQQHQQVVRGPVLIRSPPRMSMPLLHHPTSPFMMYPRRATPYSSPGTNGHLYTPPPPPMNLGNGAFRSNRPLQHSDFVTGGHQNMALHGMYRSPVSRVPPHHTHRQVSPTPTSQSHHMMQYIPRVSPVVEPTTKSAPLAAAPLLPDLGSNNRLERKEETAIDAMLSLHRSPSKSD